MENRDIKNEGKENTHKYRNKKRKYWRRSNASRRNDKIQKAKDLREELLKLQDHINDKYHSG